MQRHVGKAIAEWYLVSDGLGRPCLSTTARPDSLQSPLSVLVLGAAESDPFRAESELSRILSL
jgi:hypothetical protein